MKGRCDWFAICAGVQVGVKFLTKKIVVVFVFLND